MNRRTVTKCWLFSALLAAGLAILFLPGCITDYDGVLEETGILYHYNWWNFYHRGSVFFRQGKIERAAEDFERCLGLRSGAKYEEDRDMWRARTYGMHFLEGYFPNRELGICLYTLGRIEEAAPFLETSLQQAPSGRAKHYLNLVNRKLLTAKKPPPPAIHFALDSEAMWTRERYRNIDGTAVGNGLISDITINGSPVFIELAQKSVSFHRQVQLQPGTNVISVAVVDLIDQTQSGSLRWIADWYPPHLGITRMDRSGDEWTVEGICYDNFGIASVEVSGATAFERIPSGARNEVRVRMRFPAGHAPIFTAEDLAGNVLETPLSQHLRASGPNMAGLLHLAPAGLSDAGSGAHDPDSWIQIASIQATDTATDAQAPILAGVAPEEKEPPETRPDLMLSDQREVVRVLDEEYFLDGAAADIKGIAAIIVNNVDILPPKTRGAIRAYFARRIPLAEGENIVTITVKNTDSKTITRRITIVRAQAEYMNEDFRLTLSFPPLPSSRPDAETQMIRRLLERELLRSPARFNMVEREDGWEHVLRELRISTSELADPRVALRIRKVIPSDMILVASLISHKAGITVYARAIDTETGEVLDFDVYNEDSTEGLSYQVDGLAKKIKQRFPLLMAEITEVSGRTATISAGTQHGLSPFTSFVVVGNQERDSGTRAGSVFRFEGKVMKLKIKSVHEQTGITRIYPRSAAKLIKEGDYVYAR